MARECPNKRTLFINDKGYYESDSDAEEEEEDRPVLLAEKDEAGKSELEENFETGLCLHSNIIAECLDDETIAELVTPLQITPPVDATDPMTDLIKHPAEYVTGRT